MNEEFELRKRLQDSDPASEIQLNEAVVARAALGKAPRLASFKVARLTMAAASLSIVGLAMTSLSFPQQQEPLFALASAGQSGATMAIAESAPAAGKMAADSMMIWPGFSYNHVAGDLDRSTGTGKVYQAELTGDPIAFVGKLAEYFGIEGTPRKDDWSTEEYPSYSIQGENYSAGIYFSGTGNWYFNNWDSTGYGCFSDASAGTESDGTTSEGTSEAAREYCEPKPTPELIPSEKDLVAQATRTFGELGFSVNQADAKVYRSEWGASITFPNIQNGINTGMDFYAGWDSKGTLNYISGHSFRLIDRGEFDTISAYDAVARIADGRWYGGAPSIYYENLYVEAGVAAPLAREATSEIAVDEPAPSEGEKIEVVEPMPADEFPEPVVQDLLVVKSEVAMLSVYDAAGNFWLVPGHLLYNDQGWFDAIISLEDGVIALPEPMNYDIMPIEEPMG